nr:Sua5/YciO/YrdC/YwlC family protein [Vibrio sp. 03_296]
MAVAAPSANPYKKLSPTSAKHVMNSLGGKIAAVLDGGDCAHGLESTIVDLTENLSVFTYRPSDRCATLYHVGRGSELSG